MRQQRSRSRLPNHTSLPLFSLLVPLGFALVMWLVASSPVMMLFALMGPLAMGASLLDARRQTAAARRTAAEEAQRVADQGEAQRREELEREATKARRQHPSLADLLDSGHRPETVRTASPQHVRVGLDRDKRPVLVPLDSRLCVIGESAAAARASRSLSLVCAWHSGGGRRDEVTSVRNRSEIPSSTTLTVTLADDGWATLTDVRTPLDVVPVLLDELSDAHATAVRRELSRVHSVRYAPPTLDDLCRTHAAGSTGDLTPDATRDVSGIVGWRDDVSGPVGVTLSLEHDGPHFLIAGATGSGKTETLVALIATMAARQDPARFRFAVIDFKGGGGFVRVAGLPHSAGITTDLDGDDVLRALSGIRVDMERREQLLRESGRTDIAHVPADRALPRLLIVVDEYRALCEQVPDARRIMADVAARGRALGVHLALASQRAAGAFSDDLIVNAQTRLCLTPVGDDDARYLLGVSLPHPQSVGKPSERQLLLRRRAGEVERVLPVCADARTLARATEMCVRAGEGDVPVGRGSEAERPNAWRLWWPELPRTLSDRTMADSLDHNALAPEVVRLGLRQDVRTTRWLALDYSPTRDGSLAVVGGPRSGKSTLLDHLGRSTLSTVVVPRHPALAWDVLTSVARRLKGAAGVPAALIVVDGLDAILRDTPDEYGDDLISALETIARDGPRRGTFIAFSASTDEARLSPIVRHVSTRLTFDTRIPGRGLLDGDTVQVLRPVEEKSEHDDDGVRGTGQGADDERNPDLLALGDVLAGRRAVVVTENPEVWTDVTRAGDDAPTLDVLTSDQALSVSEDLRRRLRVEPVVWHGVSRLAARYVGRDPRLIPPPLKNGVVVLEADDTVKRAALPPTCVMDR